MPLTETDPLMPLTPEPIPAQPLTGEEQIKLKELELDSETTRLNNENLFKLNRTEARVKAGVAVVSGLIVVTIVISLVVLTLNNKKAPESIGPILPMLIGLMSGVAISQRSNNVNNVHK